MDNNPCKMSLLLFALMDVVLAFLFLACLCISIISSTIIRIFHLRPPRFRIEPYGGVGGNTRPQENPSKFLWDNLAKKLSLLQCIIFNRRLSPVHNLCEDCMLLNCTSTQEISSHVNNTPDSGHIDERFSSLYARFHVNNCCIRSSKRQNSVLPCAFNPKRVEESPGLQFEAGSESGSSASFTSCNSTACCCCCKEFIREMQSKDEFVKEKFAKVYVDDFGELTWEQSNTKSSSSATAPISLCEMEQNEISEQQFCSYYAERKDKNQEVDLIGDEPTLEHNAFPSDCKTFVEGNNDGELHSQINDVHCELSSNGLLEEGHDGEEQSLQNHSVDCNFHLITPSEGKEQVQNENSDCKRSLEVLMAKRETLGSILPLNISERYLEPAAIPLGDHDHARAAVPSDINQRLQNNQQRSEADEIKELRDALEAEREAYSSICLELEEERNASAIAANETMAMISRLQEEKATVQMESRQFKRMVEERAAFEEEAIALLKDILCKREEEKLALEREVELYRSRLLDHKTRKWSQQRWTSWKREDHEKCNGKEKLQLPDWNEKNVLLLEGAKDEDIIKEGQRLQGTLENNRSFTSRECDLAGTSMLMKMGSKMKCLEDPIMRAESEKESKFMKRIDELLLSSNGKPLPDDCQSIETKSRQDNSWLTNGLNEGEDENRYLHTDNVCEQKSAVLSAIVENLCSTNRRSYAPEEKGTFIEETDKVGDASYFCLTSADSWEMHKSMSTASEDVPSSTLGGLETLSSSLSNLYIHESACMGTSLENNTPYSEREDDEHLFSGRCSLESEDEFHLDPCKYIDDLDDCITIEVAPTPINSTEHLSSQKVLDVKVMPSSIERYEIHNELYKIPADFPPFKVSHKACPENAENAVSADRQARERETYDMTFSKSFAMCPGNGWQHGELKDSKDNGRLALTSEQRSEDDSDQDSLSSANEFIPDLLGYDHRTASMIKRDHQRTAVEEEVNQLTLRLQVLEDDRHVMKNLMENFRPENRKMQFPDDIDFRLQQLHGFDEKLENLKKDHCS